MDAIEAKERLYLTEDSSKLVAEGDVRGAFLYVAPGDLIPREAHEKFGLVDGALPKKKAAAAATGDGAAKAAKAPANKGGKAPANKAAAPASDADAGDGQAQGGDAGAGADQGGAAE